MLLTDLISMSTNLSKLNISECLGYLQKAYEIIIDNIALQPGIFPMLIKTEVVAIQKFQYKCQLVGIGSEIAFKELRDFIDVDFQQNNNNVINDVAKVSKAIIGKANEQYFGFSKTDYDAMNAMHTINIKLFNSKQYYNLINKDEVSIGFCNMVAYQYPYPVYTNNNPLIDLYSYNIGSMVDLYEIENLRVDDVVGPLMALKASQLYKEDILDIGNAKHFDYICTHMINLYNLNNESIRNNKLTTVGFMKWQQ